MVDITRISVLSDTLGQYVGGQLHRLLLHDCKVRQFDNSTFLLLLLFESTSRAAHMHAFRWAHIRPPYARAYNYVTSVPPVIEGIRPYAVYQGAIARVGALS